MKESGYKPFFDKKDPIQIYIHINPDSRQCSHLLRDEVVRHGFNLKRVGWVINSDTSHILVDARHVTADIENLKFALLEIERAFMDNINRVQLGF